ncbi:hypothetical protein QTO30_14635 [Yoonia sp. GPGPB17]|uniref:DUF6640 family protein n=1 Tax=Yoonia sp. GPGPB17 TaxID=3026147 RepID=UPI0030C563C6
MLKIVVSLLTVFYGLVPAIADLNETHLLNPLWSEHARFHGAWFLAFAAGIALTALFLIWVRDQVVLPIVFGLLFAGGFWVATLFQSAYGGGLVDPNGFEQQIMGFESNLFLFSVVSVLFLAALGFSVKFYGSSSGDE